MKAFFLNLLFLAILPCSAFAGKSTFATESETITVNNQNLNPDYLHLVGFNLNEPWSLFDDSGVLIITSGAKAIDLNDYPKGIYYLHIGEEIVEIHHD